jgi:glycine betaine/choline ABC-type transport system substrate-binding protein
MFPVKHRKNRRGATYDRVMAPRLRCTSCGNLTRFDVVRRTRTSAFHHYSTGGRLAVEDVVVLEDEVESVTCRWCGPVGRVQEFDDADELAEGSNSDV